MVHLRRAKANPKKEVTPCQNTPLSALDVEKKRKWTDYIAVPITAHPVKQSKRRNFMDTTELHRIIKESTVSLRKGPMITEKNDENVRVTEIWAMPHESDPTFEKYPKIDVGLFTVAIFPEKAEKNKAKLIEIMRAYPDQYRLSKGPSYIEVGAEIGSQEAAFKLAALGSHLGLCNIMSPLNMGFDKDVANEMIGGGFFFIAWRTSDEPMDP